LITLSKSALLKDKRLHKQVYGVAFFGVPHAGMDTRSLIPMVGDQPNRSLVDSIGPISQLLVEQRRLFKPALGEEGQAEVFCFYETLKSKTAVKVRPSNICNIIPSRVKLTEYRMVMEYGSWKAPKNGWLTKRLPPIAGIGKMVLSTSAPLCAHIKI
jgi:hypothetical protein